MIAAWGMWAKIGPTGVLDHPSRIFLLDPRGRQREIYSLEFLKPIPCSKMCEACSPNFRKNKRRSGEF